jgi:hypothetical protein
MTLRSKIALFVVALSVAAVGAANASAATPPAKLNITSIGNDRYTLTADVYTNRLWVSGFDVTFRLWGEDEWYDDLLYTPPCTTFRGTWTSHVACEFTVSGSTLNEDWGSDEIYVDARLYDHHTGKLVETAQTNRLYGSWS